MTRWSAITRTPPPLLRARLRLALHSRGGKNLNPVVHHERGRYSDIVDVRVDFFPIGMSATSKRERGVAGCLGSKPLSLPEPPRIAWKRRTFARPIRSAPIGAIAHEHTGCGDGACRDRTGDLRLAKPRRPKRREATIDALTRF